MFLFKSMNIFTILFFLFVSSCAASDNLSESKSNEDDEDSAMNGDDWGTPLDFHEQCSDAVCDFRMDEGDRLSHGMGTWHLGDTGIGLEGAEVVISVTDEFAAHPEVPVECYEIRILGNWDEDVEVYFEMLGEYGIFGRSVSERQTDVELVSDYEGEFEYSKRLPHGDWKLHTMEVRTLAHRGGIKFSIRKVGAGDARFYYIDINGKYLCSDNAIVLDEP